MKINVGEKWRLKRDHSKVATVLKAVNQEITASYRAQPGDTCYVILQMPWIKSGEGGKAIDTFLKQYEKVSETNP